MWINLLRRCCFLHSTGKIIEPQQNIKLWNVAWGEHVMYHLLNMIFTLPQFPSHPCSPLSHKHKKPIEERKCDDLIKKFPEENVSHVPQCDLHYVLAHWKMNGGRGKKLLLENALRKCQTSSTPICGHRVVKHLWCIRIII